MRLLLLFLFISCTLIQFNYVNSKKWKFKEEIHLNEMDLTIRPEINGYYHNSNYNKYSELPSHFVFYEDG